MNSTSKLPFTKTTFEEIAREYATPVFVYDETGIRAQAKKLNQAFAWTREHNKTQKNFFAVKATPTPAILRILHDEGMGFDCSSRPELSMVKQNGLADTGVSYSSNNTPDEDYVYADAMGAIINIDKVGYVVQVQRALGGLPMRMSVRLNPGKQKSGNDIIGEPFESKFGARPDQVIEALVAMRTGGVAEIGVHVMVVSGETSTRSFVETAEILAQFVHEAKDRHGITVDFLNIGGGIGLNYRPEDPPADVIAISRAMEQILAPLNIPIYSEFGRYITGQHGYLLTSVTHGMQETWHKYVQVDTSINNMARLATVKNAYHQITVLGKENEACEPMHIAGSMCANSDKMLKNVPIPSSIASGDLLVIHDAGAHARANSHNYNFRLRAGEVLVHPDGSHSLIRRAETEDDLFSTTKGL